jgi:hypothetical protein
MFLLKSQYLLFMFLLKSLPYLLFMFLWFNRVAVSQLIYNFVSAFSHYVIIHILPIYTKKWMHYTFYNMAASSL